MAVLSLRMRSELVLSWVNDSRGRVMHKEIGSKMIVRFKRFVTVLAVIGWLDVQKFIDVQTYINNSTNDISA